MHITTDVYPKSIVKSNIFSVPISVKNVISRTRQFTFDLVRKQGFPAFTVQVCKSPLAISIEHIQSVDFRSNPRNHCILHFAPFQSGAVLESDGENEPSKSPNDSSKAKGRRSRGTGAKQYESFTLNETQYSVGDDIVITMPKEEGSWGVARITKIYHDELADDIPLLRLLWFWRATEVMIHCMDSL